MKGQWEYVVAGLIGLIGALTVVVAALEANHVRYAMNVGTEDPEIVNLIYMGKALERYSSYLGESLVEPYFERGGAPFCGDIVYEGTVISVWENESCSYHTLSEDAKAYLRDYLMTLLVETGNSRALGKFSDMWGISIHHTGEKLELTRTSQKSLFGRPPITSTMGFQWEQDMNQGALEGALLDAKEETEGEELPGMPLCDLFSGTLTYEEQDYAFNVIFCE